MWNVAYHLSTVCIHMHISPMNGFVDCLHWIYIEHRNPMKLSKVGDVTLPSLHYIGGPSGYIFSLLFYL